MQKLLVGLLLALVHCIFSVGTLAWVFGHGMSYTLDGKAVPSFYRAINLISDLLLFPVATLTVDYCKSCSPGLWGYVPFFINSLLWAYAIVVLSTWGYRKWRSESTNAMTTLTSKKK